jgi:arabinogalactan endo-1,4-beta-galactosidase
LNTKQSKRLYQTIVRIAVCLAMTVTLFPMQQHSVYAAAAVTNTISVAPVTALQGGKRSDFIMGADVSELYELEKHNKKFYDTDDIEKNALQILKNHGVNYIRLRLWNDPTDALGDPIGGGNNDLAKTIVIAQKAKALGINVLLDYHYSDFWADPGKQNKPKAWINDTGATLQSDVYNFTYNTLMAMKAQGVLPQMVQIGNEINGGLLWPDGDSPAKAAPFLQKAAAAVRAADPNTGDPNNKINIMIHIAGNSSGSVGTFTNNLDAWTTNTTAVDFDIIGISDYPYWHGTMAQNAAILNTLAATYNKPVVVAETAYAWTLAAGDETINNFDQSNAYTSGYAPTPQGQAAAIRDVINNVANVPGNKGLGIFYWGADWLPGDETGWIADQGSGWENQALFDFNGYALPSIDVFNKVRTSSTIPVSDFVSADPVTVSTNVYGTPNLPATVQGIYSDGFYKSAAVTSWVYSTVDVTTPGVYTAHGTIGNNANAATAIVTVQTAQPPNFVTNPGLEGGATGWTSSNASIAKPQQGGSTPNSGTNAIHFWNGSAFNGVTVTQTIYGLPNGIYTLSVYGEGDAKGSSVVPYLYAEGYDSSNPSAKLTQNFTPTGWNKYTQYSITVTVTSGKCTIGVNINGAADAWGDVDDFYFGLPPAAASENTKAQPVTVSTPVGAPLSNGAIITANTPYITLSNATPGATIFFTTDGSEPGYSSNSSITKVYAGPIKIAANTVLKTYAIAPGYLNSSVSSINVIADYSSIGSLVPNGSFEQAGTLGAWQLNGVTEVNEASTTFDAVQSPSDVFEGNGGFKYYSTNSYKFTLSQKVSGLSNGIYTLSAESRGGDNSVIDSVGRASSDPSKATLTLSAQTQTMQGSANIINQYWNVWKQPIINHIYVTDGTCTITFTADGSAGYWGFLDNVMLLKTADLPSENTSGNTGGNTNGTSVGDNGNTTTIQPSPTPVTIDKGTVQIKVPTDEKGIAVVKVSAADIKTAIEHSTDQMITIQLKPAEGAKEVQINIPVQQIVASEDAKIGTIKVDTGFASLWINAGFIKKIAGNTSMELQLAVAKVDTTQLSASVQEKLGGSAVYEFTMSVDGTKVSQFNGNDVKIAMNYTLQSGETPNKIVIYYVNESGKLEAVKNGRYNPETGKVEFKAKHFSKYAAAYSTVAFKDMAEAVWAKDGVEALAARDAVSGIGDGNFNPNGKVTRAEFIQILLNAFDLVDTDAKSTMQDVQEGAWYYNAVATAEKLGITNGKAVGIFGINDQISRQDMAVMVYKATQLLKADLRMGTDITEFEDQRAIADYAAEAVKAIQQAGIMDGVGNGIFAPQAESTRAQAATIIYRLYNIVK